MRRAAGIAFGVGNHLLFACTVWHLFWFLKGFNPASLVGDRSFSLGPLLVDSALALGFAIPHSTLLLPGVRKTITKFLPDAFYGTLFCTVTCASLLVVFQAWQPSPIMVCRFTGFLGAAIQAAFYASWIALFYSLSLTGFGYQTGWTPWWNWLRRRPQPPRNFAPRGAYLWLRHPVYLSFLGLVWFVPVVSIDRAVLIAVWSAYIFVGSWLKDRRLTFYLGEKYRRYQSIVRGYPGMTFGPLARVPMDSPRSANILFLPTECQRQSIQRAA